MENGKLINGLGEIGLKNVKIGEIIQAERIGFMTSTCEVRFSTILAVFVFKLYFQMSSEKDCRPWYHAVKLSPPKNSLGTAQ